MLEHAFHGTLVLFLLALTALLCWWAARGRDGRRVTALIPFYAIGVVSLTLLRRDQLPLRTSILTPFLVYVQIVTGHYYSGLNISAELLGNVVLFLPLGLLLYLKRGEDWPDVVLLGFGCSLCIELFQYFSRLGTFQVDDLIHNTWGALIGWGLGKALFRGERTSTGRALAPLLCFGLLWGSCTLFAFLQLMIAPLRFALPWYP